MRAGSGQSVATPNCRASGAFTTAAAGSLTYRWRKVIRNVASTVLVRVLGMQMAGKGANHGVEVACGCGRW